MSSTTSENPVKKLAASFALVALGIAGGYGVGHYMDQSLASISAAQIAASPARPQLLQSCLDREVTTKIADALPEIARRLNADQTVTPPDAGLTADYKKAVQEKCNLKADNDVRAEIFQEKMGFAPLFLGALALMSTLCGTVSGAVGVIDLVAQKKKDGPAPR